MHNHARDENYQNWCQINTPVVMPPLLHGEEGNLLPYRTPKERQRYIHGTNHDELEVRLHLVLTIRCQYPQNYFQSEVNDASHSSCFICTASLIEVITTMPTYRWQRERLCCNIRGILSQFPNDANKNWWPQSLAKWNRKLNHSKRSANTKSVLEWCQQKDGNNRKPTELQINSNDPNTSGS